MVLLTDSASSELPVAPARDLEFELEHPRGYQTVHGAQLEPQLLGERFNTQPEWRSGCLGTPAAHLRKSDGPLSEVADVGQQHRHLHPA